jgi:RNA 3'-terminal phosphate cyclase (ATP)
MLKDYDVEIKTECVPAASAGSGIVLWRRFLGADALGERGKSAEQVGREAVGSLLSVLDSGAATDGHLSDQLLVFMALAAGRSSILVPELTRHAQTNMDVIKRFGVAEFDIEPKNGCILIACEGT